MNIKITNLDVKDRKEIGIDQHKNVYERLCNTTAWSEIYTYRHIPTIKPSSYEKIRTITEKDLFCWGSMTKETIGKNTKIKTGKNDVRGPAQI